MKSVVYTGEHQVECQDRPIPEVPEGWALIKVSHAGICGSDLTIFAGRHPRAKAPLIMGHEFSGYLQQDIPGIAKGTLVTVHPLLPCGKCAQCLSGNIHVCETLKLVGIDRDGGMAEYAVAPQNMIIPAPEGLSAKMAAFVEPIAVTVHAVRKVQYQPGDSVVLFGAGGIGLATAITLRRFGATQVTVCEPNPVRVEVAKKLGFNAIQSSDNLKDILLQQTNGQGFDYVFDCAGHQSVADILPDVVKIGGKIEIIAGYKYPPTMNFQQGMFREFSIQFTRNQLPVDFQIAAKLAAEIPEYEELVNYELRPEDAKKAFELLTTPSDALKVMFNFD